MRVLLSVEDQQFVIDTNEAGEPRIRPVAEPVAERDTTAVAYLVRSSKDVPSFSPRYTIPLLLKVEALP